MRVEFKSRHENCKIIVTYPTTRDSNFSVRAYAVDKNYIPLDEIKEVRRKVKNKEALDITILFARNAVESKLDNIFRPKIRKVDDGEQLDTPFSLAFKTVLNLGYHSFPWSEHYTHDVLVYSKRNIVPWYVRNIEDKFTIVELNDLEKFLANKIMTHGNFSGNYEDALAGAANHLAAFEEVYGLMMSIDPSLPPQTFKTKSKTGRTKVEQEKMMSPSCHLEFRRRLEEKIETEPKKVRAAAFMDNDLRTGEASAMTKDLMASIEDIIVAWVLYQEDNGGKNDVLKSKDSYRRVVLDEWGSLVVKRCNELITEEDTVDCNKAPVMDSDLSSFVKEILLESGVEEELFVQAKNSELRHLKHDTDGTPIIDISAHILRRNRASIRCNICGFSATERDVFIGHKKRVSRFTYDSPQWDSTIKRIIVKNSLYDINQNISLNPKHKPIELIKGVKEEVFPFPVMRFKNNSDTDLVLDIDIKSCEPGESISIEGSDYLKVNLERRSTNNNGKRRKENLIGGVI